MTVSAVARLMPRPPARVLRRKRNLVLPSLLNSSICASRSSLDVEPSSRQYSHCRNLGELGNCVNCLCGDVCGVISKGNTHTTHHTDRTQTSDAVHITYYTHTHTSYTPHQERECVCALLCVFVPDVIFEDVQQTRHLTEDENARSPLLQLLQKLRR